MVKRVFSLPLRGLQEFINAVFKLVQWSLSCPYCLCIIKRAKMVNVAFKTKTKGLIRLLTIHSAKRKIYGEGEC
ncbi:Mobile element protein [Candidatus Enterovibrio altilux]|uniref:Mobile element protein n=1 Tax=Candidatus Enterovibrio altilux TaxID=1927128 RepID=A0A291B9I0_9GAMM|nr:Mobile element protein [Candidatus Enterovibrio luxaltus]